MRHHAAFLSKLKELLRVESSYLMVKPFKNAHTTKNWTKKWHGFAPLGLFHQTRHTMVTVLCGNEHTLWPAHSWDFHALRYREARCMNTQPRHGSEEFRHPATVEKVLVLLLATQIRRPSSIVRLPDPIADGRACTAAAVLHSTRPAVRPDMASYLR